MNNASLWRLTPMFNTFDLIKQEEQSIFKTSNTEIENIYH
ncbi:hypothetical protein PEDI_01240 [Persicobacter diffluens]|uniref:Uncharacterized protein n=1 Tax=Persicobacter diffluens TaxID=981 RepID=A0AAN4VUD1_9BACT|nr:hypothetical protein PEDI_01240 [Persicobacter diffluens]